MGLDIEVDHDAIRLNKLGILCRLSEFDPISTYLNVGQVFLNLYKSNWWLKTNLVGPLDSIPWINLDLEKTFEPTIF